MKTFVFKTVSILGVAAAAVLSSLPGLTQTNSPTNTTVPATPGATTGGDSKNQVESVQQNDRINNPATPGSMSPGTPDSTTTGGDSRMRVETQQQGGTYQQTPSAQPNTTNTGQPTDDGQRPSPTNDSVIQQQNSQQRNIQQQNGSMQQPSTTPNSGTYQQTPSPQPNTTNTGEPTDDGQRANPTNGSVIQQQGGTTSPSSNQTTPSSTSEQSTEQGVRALW